MVNGRDSWGNRITERLSDTSRNELWSSKDGELSNGVVVSSRGVSTFLAAATENLARVASAAQNILKFKSAKQT